MAVANLECDLLDQLLLDDDEIIMPLPDFESEPHLLISKVKAEIHFSQNNYCMYFPCFRPFNT